MHPAVIAVSFRCSSGLPGTFAVSCWQFRHTTASLQELVNVCKLQCFSSLRHHAKGWRPTCLQAAGLQFTTAARKRVGDLHVCKLQCLSSLCITTQGLVIYMHQRVGDLHVCYRRCVHTTAGKWRALCLPCLQLLDLQCALKNRARSQWQEPAQNL